MSFSVSLMLAIETTATGFSPDSPDFDGCAVAVESDEMPSAIARIRLNVRLTSSVTILPPMLGFVRASSGGDKADNPLKIARLLMLECVEIKTRSSVRRFQRHNSCP